MSLNVPKIALDTTLKDLYSIDQTSGHHDIALVYVMPSATTQLAKHLPVSEVFVYQSPRSGADDASFLPVIHLRVIPQHYAFIAGKMDVYLAVLDDDAPGQPNGDNSISGRRIDAMNVYQSLCSGQRPVLRLFEAPKDIVSSGDTVFVPMSPMDCFLHLPHLVQPRSHYQLQSKRALAFSGVPSPPTVIIDTQLSPDEAKDPAVVDLEVMRMTNPIRQRSLPFVVKMQQSLVSYGTFLVLSELRRNEVIESIVSELRRLLRLLHSQNEHLKASTLVLQEMLEGSAVALSLFITAKGRAIFLSCCQQLLDDEGRWIGGWISYAEQARLKAEFARTSSSVAEYCHRQGYQGPVGVDVMSNARGEQLAIDVNPRVNGTTPLGFLRNFFWHDRGLSFAAVLCPVFFMFDRKQFEMLFRQELTLGSMVISGWWHDAREQYSTASIMVATVSRTELDGLIARLDEHKMSD